MPNRRGNPLWLPRRQLRMGRHGVCPYRDGHGKPWGNPWLPRRQQVGIVMGDTGVRPYR
jgi:hypothetical protein